jgi:SAM-dependent methyltransferase
MTTAEVGTLTALMDRLINATNAIRSEATIQSDVRILLLNPYLGLAEYDLEVQLETALGNRRRIDIEVGRTVIEVKRSLATPGAVTAATEQLGDYVATRSIETGQRYVGVVTDGRIWIAYLNVDNHLYEASQIVSKPGESGAIELLRWLEGVLATRRAVLPTPNEIAEQLGASSSSHALDHATLSALYESGRETPTVQLKRELWAKLLRGALGTQFTDTNELFLEHTLLVNSAEIIAHLVVGLDAEALTPATLLSGAQFSLAGLHGVVDRDFFDWVLEVPGGDTFISALARRLARFDWSAVEHDVLKVLYESVIPKQTRKALGEYYTPDWLANAMVSQVVSDPVAQRVLDPSCGSGTFLFYAVRRFLQAAEASGMPLSEAMSRLPSHVIGIDLHPVAVALARVTYLLALGRERLSAPERGSLSVPVYLGDSLGWDYREDLLTIDHLVIPTQSAEMLLSGELRFADHLLADSARFDEIVQSLVDESGRAAGKKTVRLSEGTVRRLALDEADLPELNANFVRLKELHEQGRDHVWSYYIRNAARPAWLSRAENRVDVLIGNPPWLSYRHMTPSMQAQFKSMASARSFWHNDTTATHQDLAGLFVARAVERYLKTGGRLSFVVPNSVLDREYWGGFRRGKYDGANVAFAPSWDLRRIRPHMFPRGSAVVFGTRSLEAAALPGDALIWTGRAPDRHAQIDSATELHYALGELSVATGDEELSPYAKLFSNGANLYPRLFFRVEDAPATNLGVPTGHRNVRSKRSATENPPWKELPSLTGTIESEFIWPTLLGEQVVPFRTFEPESFVIPLTGSAALLSGEDPKINAYPGLAAWMREAEAVWNAHRQSETSLTDEIDRMKKLTQQIPVTRDRVVYGKAGMHVAAALVTNRHPIVENKLYWAAVKSEDEGRYLVGVLNAPCLTDLVRPLMSYGKDERDIDKVVWKLPIPLYDPKDIIHAEIASLSRDLSDEISDLSFKSSYFVTIRRAIRVYILNSDTGRRLNALVAGLVGLDDEPLIGNEELKNISLTSSIKRLIRTSSYSTAPLSAEVEIDVDCEFDLNGRVYLWGALVGNANDDDPEYHVFADSGQNPDESALASSFSAWLNEQLTAGGKPRGRWFYFGQVENRRLRRILGSVADSVLESGVDVLTDVVKKDFYAPAGFGLKQLATAAGAQWRSSGATGADTYEWLSAARNGDQTAWDQLLKYNEDDTRGLRLLRKAIANTSPGWSLLDESQRLE